MILTKREILPHNHCALYAAINIESDSFFLEGSYSNIIYRSSPGGLGV